ncbi:hypothetical protein HPP92_007837 [Vanilla planifolia]|uniref:Uncharacterized protein n=1 Tax=Vanilla planifolia TaxID=51239 RepID=A0A835VAF7_VANPL|nr:hypothetical protein HPP92_007837 [Vanilla planifolia]
MGKCSEELFQIASVRKTRLFPVPKPYHPFRRQPFPRAISVGLFPADGLIYDRFTAEFTLSDVVAHRALTEPSRCIAVLL